MPETKLFDINVRQNAVEILRTLGPTLEKRFLNKAVRKGAEIVQASAQQRAKVFDDPSTPAAIWKEIAIYTSAKLGKENGGVALLVGVKGGAKKYVNNKNNRRLGRVGQTYMGPGAVYYWRFLEFGTSKMRAQPFMRPALAENVGPATDAIVSEINSGIDQIVAGKGG